MAVEFLARIKCTECNTTGWVVHPVIAAFNQANEEHYNQFGYYMGEIKEAQWFASNGHKKRPIVEKVKCESCQASGYINMWLDLSKLKDLLENNLEKKN